MVGNDPEQCREALRRTPAGRRRDRQAGHGPRRRDDRSPLDEILGDAEHRRHRHPLLPRPRARACWTSTARCDVGASAPSRSGINFDVGHGARQLRLRRGAPGAGAGPAARHDQLRHPRLEHRRPGLRPGDDRQQVPAPGPAAGRRAAAASRSPGHRRRHGRRDRHAGPRRRRRREPLAPGRGRVAVPRRYGGSEIGGQRLEPVAVIRAGRRYPCAPSVYAPHAH